MVRATNDGDPGHGVPCPTRPSCKAFEKLVDLIEPPDGAGAAGDAGSPTVQAEGVNR